MLPLQQAREVRSSAIYRKQGDYENAKLYLKYAKKMDEEAEEYINRLLARWYKEIKKAVIRKFRTTATDGKEYLVSHYNLDMIIAIG